MKNLWLVEEIEDEVWFWKVSDGKRCFTTYISADAEWLCETLNAIEGFKDGVKP